MHTTSTVRPSPAATIRAWLATCHSLRAEAAAVLTLYAFYELGRGLVVCGEAIAVQHAHTVVAVEQALHVSVENDVQDAAQRVPGLIGVFGVAYLTLHLGVTAGVLLWIHRRRPESFALVRTTLFVASLLALVGFVAFPTAPPRLAGIGIADTVSGHHVDLDKGLVRSLYNPYAAVPSMHLGYAVVVAAALARLASGRIVRVAGVAYPLVVLVVIVATGNHFVFDAAAGAAVVGIAAGVAFTLTRQARPVRRPAATADVALATPDELAA